MKIALRSLLGLATLVLVAAGHQTPVNAQTAISALVTATCGTPGITLTAGRPGSVTQNTGGQLCVNATVSASISGFAPGGTFANLTATNASASVALPAGAVVAFQNTGTTTVSCTLGVGSATASASQNIVPAGSTVYLTVGSNTFGACIDQTGSTSNVVALSGGTGLGTGFGGGGGSGGGGGAVTLASGAVASGAYSAGSIAAGAYVSGSVLSGAYASGSLVDITNVSTPISPNTATATKGLLTGYQYNSTQATFTNGQQGTLQGSSRGALYVATGADTFNVTVNAALPAGTNLMGKVGIDQTTVGTTNGVSLAQLGANTVLTGNGVSGTGSLRVNIASDNTAFSVNAIESGTWNITNVSGTVSLPTGAATSANQTNASQKTQIVDGSGNVIASTSNNLNVQCANCSGSGASAADAATFTAGTSTFAPAGGEFTSGGATACVTGHQCLVGITPARAFLTDLSSQAGTAITSAPSAYGTAPTGNVIGVNAFVTNTNANGSATSANSSPVVIASDQAAVAVKAASGAYASGSFASGALASGSISSGAAVSGAFVAGSIADLAHGQGTMAASVPVAIASNQSSIPVTLTSTTVTGNVSAVGPTAVGSANANPPVVIGGTATGAAGANVQGLSIVATSTAPVTATNTAVVVDLRPDSPGIITLGPANVANSVPQTISSQYPTNATTTTPTAVTATATGTTAATAATLGATASVTNYVCGFSITANATALATGTATLSGTISGSLNYLQSVLASTAGVGTLQQNFDPCIPASAANTAITITSAAAGTGGATIVNIWGYKL